MSGMPMFGAQGGYPMGMGQGMLNPMAMMGNMGMGMQGGWGVGPMMLPGQMYTLPSFVFSLYLEINQYNAHQNPH